MYPSRDIRIFYACVCLYKHVCNIPMWYHTIETTLQLVFFRIICLANQHISIHTQTPMLLTVMLSFIPIMWVPQKSLDTFEVWSSKWSAIMNDLEFWSRGGTSEMVWFNPLMLQMGKQAQGMVVVGTDVPRVTQALIADLRQEQGLGNPWPGSCYPSLLSAWQAPKKS